MVYVLGINASGFISSACLMKDGEIVVASPEERFTKRKRDQSFPHNAIKFCLKEAGIDFSDLNVISSGWNPAFYMSRSSRAIWQTFRDKGLFLHYVVNELGSSGYCKPMLTIDQDIILDDGKKLKIEYVDHHIAHACYSYYFSGLKSALALVLDGFGEIHAGSLFKFKDGKYESLALAKFPHSFGMIYSTFTQFLGFRPNHDEWKVMALAASGDPSVFKNEVYNMIKVGEKAFNNLIEVDLSYFDYYNFFTPDFFSEKFEVFGSPRQKNQPLEQRHFDIASALQYAVEERVFELLNHISEKYPEEKNLCLSGGFFMNSALNGKIRMRTKFNDPQIGPCPDDSGISIGTAFASSSRLVKMPHKKYLHSFFGSQFTNEMIKKHLDISKITYTEVSNYVQEAASFLSKGKIIGWFQGRAEFGQRALGNRSILASPIIPTMKDTINKFVKFREEFRPFAPSILEEYKEQYFKIDPNDEVYFMEKVFPFRESVKDKVPAVIHTDGTGRTHLVSNKNNSLLYGLITEFYKITGVPVLLNTSFNTNNVPIVNDPEDALRTFYNCGIDVLYMNNIRISK